MQSRILGEVVVSTEDEEIAEVARQWGAQTPFLRPPELALDETPGIDPVLHALERLPEFDSVLLLQATSPLRTAEDIDACIELGRRTLAASVVSVSEPGTHPYWMYRLDANQKLQKIMDVPSIPRRQELPTVYAVNGALYLTNADWLRQGRAFVTAETLGYIMPPARSLDLDTPLDWKLAEILLNEHT